MNGKSYLLLGVFVSLVVSGGIIHAQASDVVYQVPKDYLLEWVRVLALTMAVFAVALIVWTLVAHRRRLAHSRARMLLFVGVCCIPFPAMLMSAAVGIEQSKDVAFCDSCHMMRSFVARMKDTHSGGLAAIHFRNRYIQDQHCYRCHTDYGLFGSLKAKVAGMSHVWNDFAGSGRSVPPKTDYRFTICLNCHGQSSKFIAETRHAGIVQRTLEGRSACTECHDRSHADATERRPS